MCTSRGIDDPNVLITDGENIGIGFYEHNREETDERTGIVYPEEILWNDLSKMLNTCCSGWPEVTHWMPIPEPPKKPEEIQYTGLIARKWINQDEAVKMFCLPFPGEE